MIESYVATDRIVIGEFEKNRREMIRVSVESFKGHRLLAVRVWARGAGKNGEDIPTRAGLSIKVEKIDEFIEVLTKASNVATGEQPQ
jgi:hypothetical protein